jgi:hypothetical protein
MHIHISDELGRRLEKLAQGTGQDISALVTEAIEQRLAAEPLHEASRWQSYSASDPLLALIGSGDDEATDVSRDKYKYLADTYEP